MRNSLWTQRRRRAVEKFVAAACKTMRLVDWTVTVDFDTDCEPGALATIEQAPQSKHATIRFDSIEFLTADADTQRQCLLHELTHCYLFDLHTTVDEVLELSVKSRAAKTMAREMVRSRVEWATDALADAFLAFHADADVPATAAPVLVVEEWKTTREADLEPVLRAAKAR